MPLSSSIRYAHGNCWKFAKTPDVVTFHSQIENGVNSLIRKPGIDLGTRIVDMCEMLKPLLTQARQQNGRGGLSYVAEGYNSDDEVYATDKCAFPCSLRVCACLIFLAGSLLTDI